MQQVYKVSVYAAQKDRDDGLPMSQVWVELKDLPATEAFASSLGLFVSIQHVVGFVGLDVAKEHLLEQRERVFAADMAEAN